MKFTGVTNSSCRMQEFDIKKVKKKFKVEFLCCTKVVKTSKLCAF